MKSLTFIIEEMSSYVHVFCESERKNNISEIQWIVYYCICILGRIVWLLSQSLRLLFLNYLFNLCLLTILTTSSFQFLPLFTQRTQLPHLECFSPVLHSSLSACFSFFLIISLVFHQQAHFVQRKYRQNSRVEHMKQHTGSRQNSVCETL